MTDTTNIELQEGFDHADLKEKVTAALDSEGIDYETEKKVAEGSRVDIIFEGIVLEIKSDLSTGIDESQLRRYESAPPVDMVALVLPEGRAERERERRDIPVIGVPRGSFTLELSI